MPHRQTPRNGASGYRPQVPGSHGLNGNGKSTPAIPQEKFLGDDGLFLEEMPEEKEDVLALLGSDRQIQLPTRDEEEIERLRSENAELRSIIAEVNQRREAASASAQDAWAEREREYDSLVEEKSEVIRALHLKIKELQEGPGKENRPHSEEELQAVYDELERERTQLDQERRSLEEDRAQLQQDEEALMKQMREMEMAMSRERAEMARQRNELQRLHAELKHELELAARDASLRDRLAPLQRRHSDVANRKGAAPVPEHRSGPASAPAQPAAKPQPKKESGIFRRLFGSGG
jgi:hypothetical protein